MNTWHAILLGLQLLQGLLGFLGGAAFLGELIEGFLGLLQGVLGLLLFLLGTR